MKMLTVEILKDHGSGKLEIAGRCCRDPICLGDEMHFDTDPTIRIRVDQIEMYRRKVDALPHGYVGTIYAALISGCAPAPGGKLLSASPD